MAMPNNFNGNMQVTPSPMMGGGQQVRSPYMDNGNFNSYGNPYPPQAYQQPQEVRPQQNAQPTYIPGRMVNSENDIFPNEVPNDGNYATFVQTDLQRIYMKTWGRNGLIQTNVYELVNPDGQGQADQPDPMQVILERLDNIERMVKSNNRNPYKKPYKNQNKEKQGGEVNNG